MSDGATNSTHVAVEQSAGNGISKELMDDLSTAIIQGNTKYINTFIKLNSNLNRLNSLGETINLMRVSKSLGFNRFLIMPPA